MENIHPIFDTLIERADKERFLNQTSKVFWFTGLSGSGKSTVAAAVEKLLFKNGFFIQVLDGDNTRTGLCNNLSFSLEDRKENIRRVAETSKLFTQAGVICLNSFVSPTIEIRKMAKEIIGENDFKEIYVNAPLSLCEDRDVKGLYKKARSGEIKGMTGIDSPYEVPVSPDLEIKTGEQTLEESAQLVYNFIMSQVKMH